MRPQTLPAQNFRLRCTETLQDLLRGRDGSVEAVYLWGSIVRPDFVPGRSDIDAILLGGDSRLEETCRWLTVAVAESDPVLGSFSARPLPVEDLNGGLPRSELARLIHPKILLADFENWQLVLGRRFARPDFACAPASLDEILALRFAALRRRLEIHRRDPEREPAKYILKEISFICHVLHQLRLGRHPFSYPALIAHANVETREAVALVTSVRDGGWQEEACRSALGEVAPFLAWVARHSASRSASA